MIVMICHNGKETHKSRHRPSSLLLPSHRWSSASRTVLGSCRKASGVSSSSWTLTSGAARPSANSISAHCGSAAALASARASWMGCASPTASRTTSKRGQSKAPSSVSAVGTPSRGAPSPPHKRDPPPKAPACSGDAPPRYEPRRQQTQVRPCRSSYL